MSVEYDAAVAAEWGAYVASEAIFLGGARAFNPGDPVPASHVERGVVRLDQVDKVSAPAVTPVPSVVVPATPKKQES